MTIPRRMLAVITLLTGGAWLISSFKLISVPPSINRSFWEGYLVLSGVGSILDWRSRKDQPSKELSPSSSAVGVIVATGAIAIIATTRNADTASGYLIPAMILIITILLALVAYRFALKNRGKIGEARFDTMSNGS